MNLDDVASPADRKVLLDTRLTSPAWGGSGKSHLGEVLRYAIKLDAQTILDYGCGTGSLKEALSGSRFKDVREYDPGVAGKEAMPEPADLVVATDVLEHIEPELLKNVLSHLKALSKKGMFLVIASNAARLTLSDGRNAHLIQKPLPFWIKQFRDSGIRVDKVDYRKGFYIWASPG